MKDDLESRLLPPRRRLAERWAEIRLVPVRRERLAPELACELALAEREPA